MQPRRKTSTDSSLLLIRRMCSAGMHSRRPDVEAVDSMTRQGRATHSVTAALVVTAPDMASVHGCGWCSLHCRLQCCPWLTGRRARVCERLCLSCATLMTVQGCVLLSLVPEVGDARTRLVAARKPERLQTGHALCAHLCWLALRTVRTWYTTTTAVVLNAPIDGGGVRPNSLPGVHGSEFK